MEQPKTLLEKGSLPEHMKKVYQMPKLLDLGNLRSLTLGGSAGLQDSPGQAANIEPNGTPPFP